ncbi:MAG TPA: hypothetical protein VF430_07065 [Verrucomicrobiae bacterium]
MRSTAIKVKEHACPSGAQSLAGQNDGQCPKNQKRLMTAGWPIFAGEFWIICIKVAVSFKSSKSQSGQTKIVFFCG